MKQPEKKNSHRRTFRPAELCLWLFSLVAVTVAFLLSAERDGITFAATLIGVTALIFVAKGDPIGQVLTVVFAVLYSIASYRYAYYGEMITYLGMSAPIAALAAIAWYRHPYEEGNREVKVAKLTGRGFLLLSLLAALVTAAFYFILRALGTANLEVSTLSVTTSFFAASLTFLRSPFYGLAYGANDLVLIVLWTLAALENPSEWTMVVCFVIFFLNDLYGFFNWGRMKKKQSATATENTEKI